MNECKGTCDQYVATLVPHTGRYASGQKRCETCCVWLKWDGKWCPCCNTRLRMKPRAKKYKQRLNDSTRYAERVD